MRLLRTIPLFTLVLGFACGGPEPIPDAGSSADAGDDASTIQPCSAHGHCDNGIFCDGRELCRPGDPAADARGCVPGDFPCMEGQNCDEDLGRCLTDCDVNPDADGDSYIAIECPGGDDCDDSDGSINPGALEICDPEGRDEDCNPATLAGPSQTDVDGDGYVSDQCCNWQPSGALLCGLDCDDTDRSAHPAHPEVCDGIDNDCDGNIDEHVRATYYRDADGDLYGDPNTSMDACVQPPGYVTNADDCDDTSRDVYPGAPESCNGEDDDCDGNIDEEVSPPPATVEHCGGCNLACPTGYTCDGTTCIDRPVQVAAGYGFVAVRGASGLVYTWGTRDDWSMNVEQVPGITDAIDIAAAELTGCAVQQEGTVRCWGSSLTGDPIVDSVMVPGLANIRSVVVGGRHACGITTSGELYCWGQNEHGQLGSGDTEPRNSPIRVSGLPGAVEETVAGLGHTCARIDTGEIYCWGNGTYGALGHGMNTSSAAPVQVALAAPAGLGGGGLIACGATSDGLYCWGDSTFKQNGSSHRTVTPERVVNYPNAPPEAAHSVWGAVQGLHLSGGFVCYNYTAHTCSTTQAGVVYCWGHNNAGQLGDGTMTGERYTAAPVEGISGRVISLATGYDVAHSDNPCQPGAGGFTCALDDGGTVYCWGSNRGGLLRTGDMINRTVPTRVLGLPVSVPPSLSR